VFCEFLSEVGFPGAGRPAQNDTAVFHQQRDVALNDGLRDQRLECQRVNAVLLRAWGETGIRHTLCAHSLQENIHYFLLLQYKQ